MGDGQGTGQALRKCAWVSFCLSRPFVCSAHLCVDCVPVLADVFLPVSPGAPVGVVGAGADCRSFGGSAPGPTQVLWTAAALRPRPGAGADAQTLRAHLGRCWRTQPLRIRACPAVVRATFRQLFRRVRALPSAQDGVRPLSVGARRRGESGGEKKGWVSQGLVGRGLIDVRSPGWG